MGLRKRKRAQADADADVYAQGLVVAGDDGLSELHLCVGARSAERLEVALVASFEQLLGRHIGQENFSGRVYLVILGEITPQTPEVWGTVERVARELQSSLEACKKATITGRPVSVSVEYTSGQDD